MLSQYRNVTDTQTDSHCYVNIAHQQAIKISHQYTDIMI